MVSAVATQTVADWSDSEDTSVALIVQVSRGDESALAQLYDRTNSLVYGLALRIVRDPSAAEDIMLEVYLQVWRTAQSFDAARGTVSSWLVTLVRSRAIDWLRSRQARRANLSQPLDDAPILRDHRPNPEQVNQEADRARFVRKAMAGLAPGQRRAIELAYFSGLSQSEIASQTGLPLGTVKTRIRLGMIQLREVLGPYAEGL
jgi:RNA polymerase sigma-70 factor (ECF subfamily)